MIWLPPPERRIRTPRRSPARPQRGFIINPYTNANDPYFANVTLLLHMQGSDGSTTFTDVKGHTITANGNAQIDTAQFKWGTSSGLFDGNGDYLTTPGAAAFGMGSGDFTIEAWLRPATVSGIDVIASNRNTAGGDNNWQFYISSGVVAFQAWGPTPGATLIAFGGGGAAISAGAWTHVAVVRHGSNWYTLHSGSRQASASVNDTMADSASNALYVGKDPSTTGRDYDGWMQDLRITKGIARYTGTTYTVPIAAFPDS